MNSTKTVFAGIMSALMACTGGAVMLINGADKAGFSQSELISWFFAVYFIGGVLNLGLSLIRWNGSNRIFYYA